MKSIDHYNYMYLVVTVSAIIKMHAPIFLSLKFSVVCFFFAGLLFAFSAAVWSNELSSLNQLFRQKFVYAFYKGNRAKNDIS